MKYIPADKLTSEIERRMSENIELAEMGCDTFGHRAVEDNDILALIDSLQQDETQVDKMLCSQAWWLEQGWIMIPPDATIEGIDSLLNQVRKKLQQEQPGVDLDLDADIEMEWDSFNQHLAEYGGESEEVVWLNRYNFNEIARHFYELGLNARKEE